MPITNKDLYDLIDMRLLDFKLEISGFIESKIEEATSPLKEEISQLENEISRLKRFCQKD